MEKYKRFCKKLNGDTEIQTFLDEITTDGWRIIYYNEQILSVQIMEIIIVGAKTQNMIL